MMAYLLFAPALLVLGAVALLYLLDRRPVDARRRTGRADRRSW